MWKTKASIVPVITGCTGFVSIEHHHLWQNCLANTRTQKRTILGPSHFKESDRLKTEELAISSCNTLDPRYGSDEGRVQPAPIRIISTINEP